MDGFHRHQQQQNPGGGSFWYPSSSPPAAAVAAGYHLPHTPAAGYHAPPHPPIYHHQKQSYSNQHPIPPPQHQHQQWFHPQQQPPPPTMPMPPQGAPLPHHPPPYHGLPPPYTLAQHRCPPPQPHPMVPPPPPAYLASSQPRGNPSWTQHQVGDYPVITDRNIHYSSEEDWAAKARAWAVGNSFPEPHHTHSQFTPVGRMDEHEYSYQQPRLSTSNGRTLYNEDETVAKEAGDLASPPKSYYSSSSIYEQEVPYSYSSSQGNKEGMDQRECSFERLHSQFISPVQMSSVQPPHFDPGNRPAKTSPDACNEPLVFQARSTFDTNQCKKISYSSVDHVVAEGTLDQDIATAPFQTWNSSAAPVVVFPPIPLAPSGTQFDPAFATQPPLPIHPAPVFGGIAAPNFQAPVSPVSTPFGLGVGPSLNSAFPGDANGAFNISERPKKAAVPSWLREEIIKKKSAIASTNSVHFEAIEMEDVADMSFRRTDQADNNSVDSKRSTENEEDDGDEVETARSAAINQEIKRVLTEVLLKVTDELFDEITTKVLNEDEPRVEAVESTSHRLSPVPDVQTPKASAKIFVPVKKDSKAVHVSEISSPSPPGGDILGLANYGSDASDGDYGNDESREAALPSSRKLDNTSHHLETAVSSYGNALKNLETGKTLLTVDANDGVENERKLYLLGSTERRRNEPSRGKATGASETFEKTSSTSSRTAVEIQKDNAKGFKSSDNVGDEGGSKNESASGEGNILTECENVESKSLSGADQKQKRSQNNQSLRREVEAGLLKNDYENNKLGDELEEKINKRYKLNEQVGDRNFKRRTPTRSTSRSNSFKNSRKEIVKDKGEKGKDVERNSEHKRDRKEDDRRGGKEDRSTRVTRETLRRNSRSKSPVSRGRKIKDTSMNHHGSASSEESSDNSRKRKLQPRRNSLSASPTRSRKRQVSWSPHSRHSHHREYPYSTRNRRSRTPTTRRKSSKQLQA